MGLADDELLDLKDQRALRMFLHSKEAPLWWAGLPDHIRRAIMHKLVSALLGKATRPREIGTLTAALFTAQRLDIEQVRLAMEVDKFKRESESNDAIDFQPPEGMG